MRETHVDAQRARIRTKEVNAGQSWKATCCTMEENH
jgi:hypothetical protein